MPKNKPLLRIIFPLALLLVSFSSPAFAATEKKDATSIQSVAQSYSTPKPLQQGLIVQIDDSNKNAVKTSTYKTAQKIFGVTVAASASPVNLSSDGAGERAYVVTSGRFSVLVSTQNGNVDPGDLISISAIDGIGMKADSTVSTMVGRAVTGFNGKNNSLTTAQLKDSTGKQQVTQIGSVTVDIDIGPNPSKSSAENGVPNFVQKVAISVVGEPISAVQLYASIAVMLLGIGVVASLLYGGIQSGMTAIGRNPLAKKSIMRNMLQIIVAGVMIFIGCLVAVYLILKI